MKESQMGKLAIGFAGTLMLMSLAFTAQAQTQGAGTIQTQAANATMIHKTACGGFGRWCPPGMRRVCGPARCWCAPC
jgi:hypothetical protein